MGANIDAKDNAVELPTHSRARWHVVTVALAVLARPCQFTNPGHPTAGTQGRTPLVFAASSNQLVAAERLVKKGADVKARGKVRA